MLSIWERNSFIEYDQIVIGGGIVGLSTAYYLKKRFPKQRVLVLERGLLPSGASTKNAGFACMGSPTELLDDLTSCTEEEVLSLFLLRKKGLERLRTLLGDKEIGYKENGSYELLMTNDLSVLEKIDYLNGILFKELKTNAFSVASEKIKGFQFNQDQVKGMIQNLCEGEIDTGMMMRTLQDLVITMGIEVKTGTDVISFEEGQDNVEVLCRNSIDSNNFTFKGKYLFICNNAFAKALLPDLDIIPGRGQVLITKQIPGLSFKGIFHFEKGYYYFREYKGCVLFGGGRQLDFETESTILFEPNQLIINKLIYLLKEVIAPRHSYEIDCNWVGIMAFGKIKRPIIQQKSERLFIGVRMGGMGIAIGNEVGYQLANLLH